LSVAYFIYGRYYYSEKIKLKKSIEVELPYCPGSVSVGVEPRKQ